METSRHLHQLEPLHPFKHVEHFSIAVKEQTFVVLDVEAIDIGLWFSMAFVIAKYPSGVIVAMEEMFVDRNGYQIQNESIADFWKRKPKAFEYNMQRGLGVSEAVAEARVCSYIHELRRKTPHFFLVSDNPSFDVRILDGILIKHGNPPLSDRGFAMYAQVLDTWSYRMSLARIFNTKSPMLFQHPHVCKLLGIAHSTQNKPPIEEPNATLRHTPLHDCCEILATFFRCLDLASAIGNLIKGAIAIPPRQRRDVALRVAHPTAYPTSHSGPLFANPDLVLHYRQQHLHSSIALSAESQIFRSNIHELFAGYMDNKENDAKFGNTLALRLAVRQRGRDKIGSEELIDTDCNKHSTQHAVSIAFQKQTPERTTKLNPTPERTPKPDVFMARTIARIQKRNLLHPIALNKC